MEVITYIVSAFLFIRLGVIFVNLLTWPHLPIGKPHNIPKVSVLIPVRNEEKNIPALLSNLKKINYANIEIIILNDQSEDRTIHILSQKKEETPNITIIEGADLPAGWLGKNWACHQLSKKAGGDYWLFMDADVRLHPEAINSAVKEMESKNPALLSIFPDQEMITKGENLIVPMMHYILLSLLPLRLVYHSSYSSLSAANGQFMFFSANHYQQWHQKVKKEVIEDIAIMRLVKQSGLKGEVLLGNKRIKCRMYEGINDGIEGFTKNILAGFGNKPGLLLCYIFLISLGYFAFLFVNTAWLSALIPAVIIMRGCQAYLSHQPLLKMMLFHPVQIIAMVYISFRAVYLSGRKKITWKGRTISTE